MALRFIIILDTDSADLRYPQNDANEPNPPSLCQNTKHCKHAKRMKLQSISPLTTVGTRTRTHRISDQSQLRTRHPKQQSNARLENLLYTILSRACEFEALRLDGLYGGFEAATRLECLGLVGSCRAVLVFQKCITSHGVVVTGWIRISHLASRISQRELLHASFSRLS